MYNVQYMTRDSLVRAMDAYILQTRGMAGVCEPHAKLGSQLENASEVHSIHGIMDHQYNIHSADERQNRPSRCHLNVKYQLGRICVSKATGQAYEATNSVISLVRRSGPSVSEGSCDHEMGGGADERGGGDVNQTRHVLSFQLVQYPVQYAWSTNCQAVILYLGRPVVSQIHIAAAWAVGQEVMTVTITSKVVLVSSGFSKLEDSC